MTTRSFYLHGSLPPKWFTAKLLVYVATIFKDEATIRCLCCIHTDFLVCYVGPCTLVISNSTLLPYSRVYTQ